MPAVQRTTRKSPKLRTPYQCLFLSHYLTAPISSMKGVISTTPNRDPGRGIWHGVSQGGNMVQEPHQYLSKFSLQPPKLEEKHP